MIVADILMWLLLILGTYIVFNAYWLVAQGLFPGFVDRCRQRIQMSPAGQTVIGLAIAIPGSIIGIALLQAPSPVMKFAGAVIVLGLLLLGMIGSAGLAALIGHGLPTVADHREPWRRVLRGGAALGLTFVFPLIGWLFVLPLSLVIGIGAAVRSVRLPKQRPANPVFDPYLRAEH